MFFKQLLQSSTFRLCLIALVLCGVALTGSRSTGQAQAEAMQSASTQQADQSAVTISEVMPNATLDQVFVRCTVANVGVNLIANVVSVHSLDCSPSTGAILYFVVPADSKKANQILSIALTAKATSRPIAMVYDSTDTSGLENPENNRKILALGMD